MILLDVSLPPSAPWWAALIAIGIPGFGAAVNAWIQYRAKKPDDLKGLTDRVVTTEQKIDAISGTDSKAIAVVKEDLDALAQDVAKLREAVERRWKADDARRQRAGELAQQDRKELHDALSTLRERVAGMAGRLEVLTERSHGR
jgi:predicted  nucleic acid-binding Zn-ribbon protein